MIVSTTPTLEGKHIVRYAGLVSGEAILGANIVREMLMVSASGTAVVVEG